MQQRDDGPTLPELNLIGSAEVCARLEIDRATLVRRCQLYRIDPTEPKAIQYVAKLPGKSGPYLFDPVYINRLVIDQANAAHQAAS